jgi:NAD-dependent dihydropyrimidine dehydrogenase PreA subunit
MIPKAIKLSDITATPKVPPPIMTLETIRQLALDCGAADAGIVDIDHEMLDEERETILKTFPKAKSVISIICKMNVNSVRSPLRSVANHEFHHTGYETDEICRTLAHRLLDLGISAMNEPMAFPMEHSNYPSKPWIISHKKVAVAAGLGHMGIHRNLIHPKFGNFILLGSVVIDQSIKDLNTKPLDFNPCLECKLCVAACPVGAIGSDGYFNFSACMNHNYREFMGGFIDWARALTESANMKEYKARFNDGETVSLWQSLAYGPNYKAAYCMSVCPAGEDIIGQYKENKRNFIDSYLKPLTEKEETIYAVKGTDAEEYVKNKFPNKQVKIVASSLAANSIESFLFGSKLIFQPGKAKGINLRVHFNFIGDEDIKATYIIQNQNLEILMKHQGAPDLVITAKNKDWVRFLNKDLNLFWALITGKIKIKGNLKHFQNFGKIFPT